MTKAHTTAEMKKPIATAAAAQKPNLPNRFNIAAPPLHELLAAICRL
jgi:hypothetical protein